MDAGRDAKPPAAAGPSCEKPPRGKSACPKPPRPKPPPPPRPRAYRHSVGKAATIAAKLMATGSDQNGNCCFIDFLLSYAPLTRAASVLCLPGSRQRGSVSHL